MHALAMLLSMVCLSAAAIADETQADTEDDGQVYRINLPEQSVADALTSLSEQTDVLVLFPYDIAEARAANPVKGEYTLQEALDLLLQGTGLSGGLSRQRVMQISLDEVAERTNEKGGKGMSSQEGNKSTKKRKGLLGVLAAVFSVGAGAQEVGDADGDGHEQELDEIVVTGTTIRGVYPESAPLDIYTAEDIQLSGATTLNRFLETLPQNVNSLAAGVTPTLGRFEGRPTNTGSVDLRGLGVGTTLLLLNGRRLTAPGGGSPNTALIPLGAVERVEVLTDGASAVYGSDAIGGVVNFILRDDFEGVDVSTSYGGTTRGGHDRTQADVAAGTSWGAGNGFISYSYLTQSALDVSERDFSSQAPSPTSLFPDERAHNVMAAINQNITDRLNLFGNILYSARDTEREASTAFTEAGSSAQEDQIFLSAGLDYRIHDDLYFQIDGTYLQDDYSSFSDRRTVGLQGRHEEDGRSLDLMAKLDGKLIDLPGGEVKFSLGGGFSEQDYQVAIATLPNPLEVVGLLDRQSYFAFAEGFVPLVSEEQNTPGINRLELSAAVRYTEYSDFEAAATPRVGLLWSPVSGLNLRGTYSRGFRAPQLSLLDPTGPFARIFRPADFGFPDIFSDDGSSVVFLPLGPRFDGLEAEFSNTMTFGFDLQPEAIERLKISATYFNIDYTDRLGSPILGGTTALRNPEEFSFLFDASPTAEEIITIAESILAERITDFTGTLSVPGPQEVADFVTVLFDNRLVNLASARSEGIDVSVDYGHETSLGDLNYGARMTYTLTSTQQVSPDFPELSLLDKIGEPVSLRGSAHVGLSRGGFSSQINVHYVDSYTNTAVAPVQPIDSWATVDLNLRYGFGDQSSVLLSDLAVSLTIQNLFDADPPFVSVADSLGPDGLSIPAGYDPVNANPHGRFITVGLTRQF